MNHHSGTWGPSGPKIGMAESWHRKSSSKADEEVTMRSHEAYYFSMMMAIVSDALMAIE